MGGGRNGEQQGRDRQFGVRMCSVRQLMSMQDREGKDLAVTAAKGMDDRLVLHIRNRCSDAQHRRYHRSGHESQ